MVLSTENPETLADPKLVTYRKLPVESSVTELGVVPTTAKGEPKISLSVPLVLLMVKIGILEVTWLATYKKWSEAPVAKAVGPLPVDAIGNGDPATAVSPPPEATENADTEFRFMLAI